jgi:hypothetical protein
MAKFPLFVVCAVALCVPFFKSAKSRLMSLFVAFMPLM